MTIFRLSLTLTWLINPCKHSLSSINRVCSRSMIRTHQTCLPSRCIREKSSFLCTTLCCWHTNDCQNTLLFLYKTIIRLVQCLSLLNNMNTRFNLCSRTRGKNKNFKYQLRTGQINLNCNICNI